MEMGRIVTFELDAGAHPGLDVAKLGPHFCGIAKELGACHRQVIGKSGANPTKITLAKWIYGQRISRGRLAGADDLGECAWNMLLDLFISEAESRPLDVTSLAIGSGSPTTTALRWIQLLERRELISRFADDEDRRRWFVKMTPAGADLMARYFDAVVSYAG